MRGNSGEVLVRTNIEQVASPAVLGAVVRCFMAILLLIGLMLFMAAVSSSFEPGEVGTAVHVETIRSGSGPM